uniref:Peptidase S1 domain-containing protein n=1 Tax=Rhabditophanes sp. KR3021 TaxID=114890 RepID=A0AC35TJA5_9BILA
MDLSFGSRIVGGNISSSWPWIAQLVNYENKILCGATLLGDEFLLSAAHCFGHNEGGTDPTKYTIVLGDNRTGEGTYHDLKSISVHPLYYAGRETVRNDIALLRLTKKVKRSSDVNSICLNKLPTPNYKVCVIAGYGSLSESGPYPAFLREAFVPIIPNYICNDYMHYRGKLDIFSTLCAGYSEGKIDSCKGDSGGPLMCEVNGFWEIHGIVSYGHGCARRGKPGVYTNLHNMKAWLLFEFWKNDKKLDNFYSTSK